MWITERERERRREGGKNDEATKMKTGQPTKHNSVTTRTAD